MPMPTSKPQRKEQVIDRVIEEATDEGFQTKYVQLRIRQGALNLIDEKIANSVFPTSRHQWILNAIERELARDS